MGRTFVALVGVLLILGCSDSGQKPNPETNVRRISDSFESGLSAWTINGLDVDVGGNEIEWYLERSDDRASDGVSSAKLYVDNLTDAAKIWLERSVIVRPNTACRVTIAFDLASADEGDMNTFSILANVLPYDPTTRDDVTAGVKDGDFPEGTHNGGVQDFVWIEKSLTKTVTSRDDGTLYFILGIWGTWEGPRTYYFDNLKIAVTAE